MHKIDKHAPALNKRFSCHHITCKYENIGIFRFNYTFDDFRQEVITSILRRTCIPMNISKLSNSLLAILKTDFRLFNICLRLSCACTEECAQQKEQIVFFHNQLWVLFVIMAKIGTCQEQIPIM
jgi:hypothetical protein